MGQLTTTTTQAIVPADERQQLILATTGPLERHPAAVYLASLSASGRRTQRNALDVIAGLLTNTAADAFSCNWSRVRYQHAAAVRALLAERYSPATANKMLSALRRVLKEAWKLGLLDAERYQRAASIESVKGETLPAGREILSGELAALMASCQADASPAGIRDAALISILYVVGLRRAEVVALELADYDLETQQLKIQGKRNKQRTAYVASGAVDAMADWLSVRGDEPGALFWPINKGGRMRNRHLSTQAIYNMLVKRAKQAGISKLSPHDFRRTFVSDLLEAGADLAIVAQMAGHANVQTTARYDRRPEQAKRKTAGLLHVPYRRRIEKTT